MIEKKGNSADMLKGALIGAVVVGLIAVGYNYYQTNKDQISPEEAEKLAIELVNKQLVPDGSAKTKLLGKESGVYKFEIDLAGQKYESFATIDGKKFFVSAVEMKKSETPAEGDKGTASKEIQKSDKPVVELFVMSHCPYGTQIEKGIIPAIEALGDKIDFQLKFCDYAMHGEEELKEQMSQYCIQKEQKEKLLPYLKCFLESGKSADCQKSAGVDTGKLSACAASADSEFKVIENFKSKVGYKGEFPGFDIFKDDNSKYGVQGSPTLVVNGGQAESGRDSSSLLKTICSGFNNAPEACGSSLPTDVPNPGFGSGSGSGAGASSGSCK
jgi:hypothetical protein